MTSDHTCSTPHRLQRLLALALVVGTLVSACGRTGDDSHTIPSLPIASHGPLPQAAPSLPFPDNPDPALCGVPVIWGLEEPAWVTGIYEDELVQPVVYLYDSHLRNEVIGQIPHGGRVEIQLSQSNPELDFYRVRSLDMDPVQEGWVPAPFLSFEPVT